MLNFVGLSLKAFRHGAISFLEMRECLLSEISLSLRKNLTWLEVERSQGFLLKKRSNPISWENVGFCKKPIIQSVSFQNRSLNHTYLNQTDNKKAVAWRVRGCLLSSRQPPRTTLQKTHISPSLKKQKRKSSKFILKNPAPLGRVTEIRKTGSENCCWGPATFGRFKPRNDQHHCFSGRRLGIRTEVTPSPSLLQEIQLRTEGVRHTGLWTFPIYKA